MSITSHLFLLVFLPVVCVTWRLANRHSSCAARLCLLAAGGPGARRRRVLAIFVQHVMARVDALVADIDAGANDQLLYLILRPPAEAADELASFSVLAGRLICHVVPPNQCL